MLASLSLDDQSGAPVTLHETAKRCLTSVTGLVGIGPLRDSRRVRPQAHGGIDETRYEDGRIIALEGEVMSTVGIEDAFAEFRAITAPMLGTLDGAPALMKWTEGVSGLALQRYVRLASDVEPPLQEGAALLHYQAQFYAEDPRAYSQTLQTVSGSTLAALGGGKRYPRTYPKTYASSGGGTATFANAGNRPTPPVLRIWGACVNPQVVLLNTGQRIALKGTIAASDFIELDVARRTILLHGSEGRQNFYDPTMSQWFELPANATSNLQLVADSFDGTAHLDVIGRSAYA